MPETPDAVTAGVRRADDILRSLASRGIRPGTATMLSLLRALGDPHCGAPCVLIAGTNGKGSTATLLASLARAAGYRTGCFTSPPLVSATEQVTVDGSAARGDRLASTLRGVIGEAERLFPGRLTAFEAITAAALVVFAEEAVDLVILEAGLGGRDDATNAVDAIAGVLTTVARDHREWLGDDMAGIARQKAGIFRAGRPAVIGWLDPPAAVAAGRAATAVGALACLAAEAVEDLRIESRGFGPQRVRFTTEHAAYDLDLPLLGAHQAQNLALAVLTGERLAAAGLEGFGVRAARHGAAACRWPGRLEPFAFPDGSCVVVDGAHNASGAQALRRFLDGLGRPVSLVLAAYADKDTGAMLDVLMPATDRVLLAPLDDARSWRPDDALADRTALPATLHTDLASALTVAHRDSRNDPERIIVVCGSLRTVAASRRWLIDRGARPRG